jgi:hypothetical protein
MDFIMMLSEGSMLDWSAVFLVDKATINKNAASAMPSSPLR